MWGRSAEPPRTFGPLRAAAPPARSGGGRAAPFATLPAARLPTSQPGCPDPEDRRARSAARSATGAPERVEDPDTPMSADTLQLIILPAGIIAILFALYLARDVLSRDTGTKEMEDVAGTIFEGAVAFIRRQYTTIGILAVVGAVAIGLIITVFETKDVADTKTFGLDLGWRTGLAFIVGAACSMASGILGGDISVRHND